jgi:hypothetical protein
LDEVNKGATLNLDNAPDSDYTPGTYQKTITIRNFSENPTGALSFSQDPPGLFTISPSPLNSIAAETGNATFTIAPVSGLAATQDHEATVTVSSDVYFYVSFAVGGGGATNPGCVCGTNCSGTPGLDIVAGVLNGRGTATGVAVICIPDSVTSIAMNAFGSGAVGDTSLTKIGGANVTSIGQAAFISCAVLETVLFPKATSIGTGGFQGCTSLTTVSLPEVTVFSMSAFMNCTSLTTMSFPKTTNIVNGAFNGCSSLESVSLPLVTTIEAGAFLNCSSLISVTLPDGVNIVALTAFPGATPNNLKAVYDGLGGGLGTYVPTAPRPGNGSDNTTVEWMKQ